MKPFSTEALLEWVRANRYCDLSGEPREAVEDRIREGIWAAGKHYKRTGPRTLWINIVEANKWIENQPHVEALCPKVSRSASGNTARASA